MTPTRSSAFIDEEDEEEVVEAPAPTGDKAVLEETAEVRTKEPSPPDTPDSPSSTAFIDEEEVEERGPDLESFWGNNKLSFGKFTKNPTAMIVESLREADKLLGDVGRGAIMGALNNLYQMSKGMEDESFDESTTRLKEGMEGNLSQASTEELEQFASDIFDFVTLGKYDANSINEAAKNAGKFGAEFMIPLPGGSLTNMGIKGAIGGLAYTAAKEADLPWPLQMAAIFAGEGLNIARGGAAVAKGAYDIFRNPAKVKAIATDWLAKFQAWRHGAKSSKIDEELLKGFQEIGADRLPLAAVVDNPKLRQAEAAFMRKGATAPYYQDLLRDLDQATKNQYLKVLTEGGVEGDETFQRVMNQADRDAAQEAFRLATEKRLNEVTDHFNHGFDMLEKTRPEGALLPEAAATNFRETIKKQINKLEMGGLTERDSSTHKWLNGLLERITSPEAKSIEQEIAGLERLPPSDEVRETIRILKGDLEEAYKQVPLDEVEAAYRKVNDAVNFEGPKSIQAVRRLGVKDAAKMAIEEYGQGNDVYLTTFNNLNKAYATAKEGMKSEIVWRFVNQEPMNDIFAWMSTPEGAKVWRSIKNETPAMAELSPTIEAAFVQRLVGNKLLDGSGNIRTNIASFYKENSETAKKLIDIVGAERFNDYMELQRLLEKKQIALSKFVNHPGTAYQAESSLEGALILSAGADGVKAVVKGATASPGALKDLGSAAMKLVLPVKNKFEAMLMTNKNFQDAYLNVIREAQKAKPNEAVLGKWVELLKEYMPELSTLRQELEALENPPQEKSDVRQP